MRDVVRGQLLIEIPLKKRPFCTLALYHSARRFPGAPVIRDTIRNSAAVRRAGRVWLWYGVDGVWVSGRLRLAGRGSSPKGGLGTAIGFAPYADYPPL